MDITAQLNELLKTVINVVIIPIIPVITTFLITLIKKKTSEIENQIRDAELRKYIEIAEHAVVTAVAAVSQTYSDHLKRGNSVFTPEQQKVALDMAKDKAAAIIGQKGMHMLKKVYGNVETWLENRIEYHVHQSKG